MNLQEPLWEEYQLKEVHTKSEQLRQRLVKFDASYFGTPAMVVVILFYDFTKKSLRPVFGMD
jgi:hypothetical protein